LWEIIIHPSYQSSYSNLIARLTVLTSPRLPCLETRLFSLYSQVFSTSNRRHPYQYCRTRSLSASGGPRRSLLPSTVQPLPTTLFDTIGRPRRPSGIGETTGQEKREVAQSQPRGRRSKPLSDEQRRHAKRKRQDKSVCVRCKLSKQKVLFLVKPSSGLQTVCSQR
jgi:hypothetical protein